MSVLVARMVIIVGVLLTSLLAHTPGRSVLAQEATPPSSRTAMSAGWPMYRGNPARTGEMSGSGLHGQPVELWRFQTEGSAYRSPAIVDGVVYTGSSDGFLYALDQANGEELWRYETDSSVEITPTVSGGTVYLASANGTLAAIDAASGEEQWRFANPVAGDSTPAVVDDVLFIGSEDGSLYAIEAAAGEERWRFSASGGVTRSVAVADGIVYAGTEAGQLHAVDAATGEERWSFVPEETVDGERIGTPTVANRMVYANYAGTMYALDAASGEESWRNTFEGARPLAAAGGMLFSGGLDGQVYALDAADGDVRWTFATDGRIQAAPAVVGDTVYVASFDRTVYALDAATGEERWRFAVDGEMDYGPSVAGGVVYVSTDTGSVYAIGGSGVTQSTASGTAQETRATAGSAATPMVETASLVFLWQTTGGAEALNGPEGMAVDAGGNLYVVDSLNDRIQVFDPEGNALALWGETGSEPGQFRFHHQEGGFFGDVAIAPDGSIFVTDVFNDRIQKFSADRAFLLEWGASGSEPGQFAEPGGIAVDATGRVYVADWENSRVQVFDAQGQFLHAWGGHGVGEGQFDAISDLAIDPAGTVYVTDQGGGCNASTPTAPIWERSVGSAPARGNSSL
jgi:eukaryotic-like serine/threonine-protein kinase